MRKLLRIAMLGTLLSILAFGPSAAEPFDAQTQSGRTRDQDAGRDAGGSRERPDLPTDVDALVRMLRSPTGPVEVGDRVTIAIDITARRDVGHAPFHVRFDPEVLAFESGEEGVFLGNDGTQTAFFSNATTAGDAVVVGLSRLGRGAGAEGAGRLCTLHFVAIAPGNANLEFARASVRDGYNQILKSRFDPARVRVR